MYNMNVEVVYSDDKYTVHHDKGRGLFMYWTESLVPGEIPERCATILGGMGGFERQFQSDFSKWIKHVQKRDLKTMQSYRRQAEDFMRMARALQSRNNFTETQFNG